MSSTVFNTMFMVFIFLAETEININDDAKQMFWVNDVKDK